MGVAPAGVGLDVASGSVILTFEVALPAAKAPAAAVSDLSALRTREGATSFLSSGPPQPFTVDVLEVIAAPSEASLRPHLGLASAALLPDYGWAIVGGGGLFLLCLGALMARRLCRRGGDPRRKLLEASPSRRGLQIELSPPPGSVRYLPEEQATSKFTGNTIARHQPSSSGKFEAAMRQKSGYFDVTTIMSESSKNEPSKQRPGMMASGKLGEASGIGELRSAAGKSSKAMNALFPDEPGGRLVSVNSPKSGKMVSTKL